MELKGIDVSVHNGAAIDFKKVKAAGIDFVMIRAGFGKSLTQKDKYFERNYAAATAAGLHVGAYWYSYATSSAEMLQEADVFLTAIKGKRFDMPVYIDVEGNRTFACGKSAVSEMVRAFCEKMEKAGYFCGIYTFRAAAGKYFTDEVLKRFALWLAEWGKSLKYDGAYGIWQYTDKGKVSGVSGNVDRDTCIVDYPSIIKQKCKNGYTKQDITYTVKAGEKLSEIAAKCGISVDDLAEKNKLISAGMILNV